MQARREQYTMLDPDRVKGEMAHNSAMQLRALKSIGSKFRIMNHIKEALTDAGGDLLVDVFGGSGSVVMNAGFYKRVYNDADGDLVNFFRVLRDDDLRPALMRRLRWITMSREEFDEIDREYRKGGRSFEHLDPVTRAFFTFYRSNYSYGGKMRDGGFSVSAQDRTFIKEAKTFRSRLKNLADIADHWRDTCLENLSYQEIVETYGKRPNAVLYCDPPYFGTERYYSRTITTADHVFLAEQLNNCQASAVVSYYWFETMPDLYPIGKWEHRPLEATKNCLRTGEKRGKVTEYLLIKKGNSD